MTANQVKPHRGFLRGLVALAVMIAFIVISWFIMDWIWGINYVVWFFSQGLLIGVLAAFISMVWKDLNIHPWLVSAHPGGYLAACLAILTGVFLSISTIPKAVLSPVPENGPKVSGIRLIWDTFISLIVCLGIFVLAFVWLITIVPAMYFVTLISGAPARIGLLNPEAKETLVRTKGPSPSDAKSPGAMNTNIKREYFDMTLCDKPVTLTFLISGAMLKAMHQLNVDMWIVERVQSLFG